MNLFLSYSPRYGLPNLPLLKYWKNNFKPSNNAKDVAQAVAQRDEGK